MKRNLFALLVLIAISTLFEACGQGNPNGPTPPGGIPTPNPMPVGDTVWTSSDGVFKVEFIQSDPKQDGSKSIGKVACIWFRVHNYSTHRVVLCPSVVDSPSDHSGRASSIFQGCRAYNPAPGYDEEQWGWDVNVPENIPYLHWYATYDNGSGTPKLPWPNQHFNLYLGWRLGQ